MARSAQDIVRAEVIYCVSGLVSTLAGYTPRMSAYDDARHDRNNRDVMDLTAQAQELSAPVADYESAAIEAGCERSGALWTYANADGTWRTATSIEEIFEERDLEPYDRDVYEHWIVSDWLADKLEAKGEKVDRDFAGMTVWARTTTGQSISIDGVIVEIAADLAREYPE